MNCEFRFVGCHGGCESYQNFYNWNAERKSQIRNQKSAERITYEVTKNRVDPGSEKWRQT